MCAFFDAVFRSYLFSHWVFCCFCLFVFELHEQFTCFGDEVRGLLHFFPILRVEFFFPLGFLKVRGPFVDFCLIFHYLSVDLKTNLLWFEVKAYVFLQRFRAIIPLFRYLIDFRFFFCMGLGSCLISFFSLFKEHPPHTSMVAVPNLHCQHQCRGLLFPPVASPNFTVCRLLTKAILISEKWYLIVILICIFQDFRRLKLFTIIFKKCKTDLSRVASGVLPCFDSFSRPYLRIFKEDRFFFPSYFPSLVSIDSSETDVFQCSKCQG